MSTIHQEVILGATPQRVYEAIARSEQFSAATGGAPADISADAGGAFSVFGGKVTGRNVELVPSRRIVQAWRAGSWEEGQYSIVRFELKDEGEQTRVVFDHSGFPDDQKEHLEPGWHKMYWEPLQKYLTAASAA